MASRLGKMHVFEKVRKVMHTCLEKPFEACKGRGLGAARVAEAKVNALREPLAAGRRLDLTAIYSVFLRSTKIQKNYKKRDFLKTSVSSRRELNS